jgi:DMSO reductase anchor subunit
VANLEEIQPRRPSPWEDVPLLLFTLLAQIAVGGFWAMTGMFTLLWSLVEYDATRLRLLPPMFIGVSLGAGMLASFAHLGTKKNAWRVLGHLRKSYLSREILFTGLFGLGWLFTTLDNASEHANLFELKAVTAIFGIGLIYSMSQVYRFPAAPGWNSWRTNVGFFISAGLLGLSSMMPVLAYESGVTGIQIPTSQGTTIGISILILLLAQLVLISQNPLRNIRIGLLIVGMLSCAIGLLATVLDVTWISVLLFLLVVVEEGIGRWIFYASRLADTSSA